MSEKAWIETSALVVGNVVMGPGEGESKRVDCIRAWRWRTETRRGIWFAWRDGAIEDWGDLASLDLDAPDNEVRHHPVR